MDDHDDGQSQELLKSKEIQEALKVMRHRLEGQVSYCRVLSSISSKFIIVVASSMGDLSPSFFLSILA